MNNTKVVISSDPSGYLASVISTCYRFGIGWAVIDTFARIWPYYLWMLPFGRIFDPETTLYFTVFANYSVWSWLLALILRDMVIRQPPPHTCESAPYANPPIEIVLLAQYEVMRIIHTWAFQLGMPKLLAILISALTDIGIVVIVIIMGNFTVAQVFLGIAWGIGFGLFCMYQIYFFWRPRLAYLAETWWQRWARAYDGVFHTPEKSFNGFYEKWKTI